MWTWVTTLLLWATFVVVVLLFVVAPFALRVLALYWVASQEKQAGGVRPPNNDHANSRKARHVLVVITSTDVRVERGIILYVRPVVNICSSTLTGGSPTVYFVTPTQFAAMWNRQMVVAPGGTLVLPMAEGGGQKTDVVVSAMHVSTSPSAAAAGGVETLCMRSGDCTSAAVAAASPPGPSDQPGFFTCVTDQLTSRGTVSTPEQLLLWSRRLGCLQRLQRRLVWSLADWWLVSS